MPMTQIFLREGREPAYRRAVADSVQKALREAAAVPLHERFQIIRQMAEDDFIFDQTFGGVERSDQFTMVIITLKGGRSETIKQSLFRAVTAALQSSPGISPDDVLIVIQENGAADWSFGKGEAQLLADK